MDQPRHIRVFISSTFRDMRADRDYLVKFAFPQLRKRCEARGVTWGEVDLRWGITDEEAAEGRVLPLCLEEIRRCRPFFIGLLGERYGWVPETVPEDLIALQPWLRDHGGRSVTELEIIHGVLGDQAMRGRAFFYFRDPRYLNRLPAGADRADFAAETPESQAKLERLKTRIRAARDQDVCRLRENYRDPDELGRWILEDLVRLIDDLYPEGNQPSALDLEASAHEAFARNRAGVYIGRPEYFERLEAQIESPDPPLVVSGESGSGKSALLANWFLRRREKHPDECAVIHFIGCAPDSADPVKILCRIMLEIRRQTHLSEDVPSRPQAVLEEFPEWLEKTKAEPVVIVLDGLNQALVESGGPGLAWLPARFPPHCRVIVSTIPGHALDELRRRGCAELAVEALTVPERKELTEQFLTQFGRRLDAARLECIASATQAANPLYLRALLDELRQFGEHEHLGERIEHYLAARNPAELYERILERWEQDYGAGLVRSSLGFLGAARKGLSEAEMLDLLGRDGEPLPMASWTPFSLAVESSLVQRDGRLDFFHDFIRAAVARRFLVSDEARKDIHRRMAGYFRRLADPDGNATWMGRYPRAFSELPFHVRNAVRPEESAAILTDLRFVEAKCTIGLTDDLLDDYEQAVRGAGLEQSTGSPLSDFARFVSGGAYWLRSNPGLIWQEAYNEKSRPHVSRTAGNLLQAGRFPPSLWLRKIRGEIRAHQSGRVISMTFWNGSRYLVVSTEGREVWGWDTSTGGPWRRFESPPSAAKSLAVSPDGKHLAAAFGAPVPDPFVSGICVWNREGSLRGNFKTMDFMYTVRWRDESTLLAGGGMPRGSEAGGTLWKARLGRSDCEMVGGYLAERPIILTWTGECDDRDSVAALSRDGRIRVVSSSGSKLDHHYSGIEPPRSDDIGFHRVAEVLSEREIASLHPQGLVIHDIRSDQKRLLHAPPQVESTVGEWICLAAEPRTRALALGSSDGSAWIVDADAGFRLAPVHKGRGTVTALCFSEDGSRLAVGDAQARVFVYRIADGAPLFKTERSDSPRAVRFAGDSICALFRDRLEVWPGATPDRKEAIPLSPGQFAMDFDVLEPLAAVLSLPTGRDEFRGDRYVQIIDLTRRRVVLNAPVQIPWTALAEAETLGAPSPITDLRLVRDGGRIRLVLGSMQGLIIFPLLAFDGGRPLVRSQKYVGSHEGSGGAIRLSDNSPRIPVETAAAVPGRPALFCAYRDSGALYHEKGELRVWDLDTESLSDAWPLEFPLTSMAPAGAGTVVVGTKEGDASSLRWESGWRRLATIRHAGTVTATACSADGHWAATVWRDGRTLIWDVADGNPVLQTHLDIELTAVGFLQGRRRIAAVDKNAEVHIWEIAGTKSPPDPPATGGRKGEDQESSGVSTETIRAYLDAGALLALVEDAVLGGRIQAAEEFLSGLTGLSEAAAIQEAWQSRLRTAQAMKRLSPLAQEILAQLRALNPFDPEAAWKPPLDLLEKIKNEFENLLRAGAVAEAGVLAEALPAASNWLIRIQKSWLEVIDKEAQAVEALLQAVTAKCQELAIQSRFAEAQKLADEIPESNEELRAAKIQLRTRLREVELLANVKQKTQELVDLGHFGQARQEIEELPDDTPEVRESKERALAQIREIEQTRGRLQAVTAKCQKLVNESRFAEARKLADELPESPEQLLAAKRDLLRQLQEVEAKGAVTAEQLSKLLLGLDSIGIDRSRLVTLARENKIDMNNPIQFYSLLEAVRQQLPPHVQRRLDRVMSKQKRQGVRKWWRFW